MNADVAMHVGRTLMLLREQQGWLESVRRPAMWGDTLDARVAAAIEGVQKLKDAPLLRMRFRLDPQVPQVAPYFLEKCIGLRPGLHHLEWFMSRDVPELQGRRISASVQLLGVYAHRIPPEDNELARAFDPSLSTLDELKARIVAEYVHRVRPLRRVVATTNVRAVLSCGHEEPTLPTELEAFLRCSRCPAQSPGQLLGMVG